MPELAHVEVRPPGRRPDQRHARRRTLEAPLRCADLGDAKLGRRGHPVDASPVRSWSRSVGCKGSVRGADGSKRALLPSRCPAAAPHGRLLSSDFVQRRGIPQCASPVFSSWPRWAR
jgi:hypothetical protein